MINILIVGFGSIGKRHFDNLNRIGGVEASVLTRRNILLPETRVYHSMAQAVNEQFDAVFITNETALHVPTAIAFAERGCHLFMEKPVADSLQDVDRLTALVRKHNLKAMVGYNMRFHPAVMRGKDLVREGIIGRVISARVEAGQYLPDWHPGEDYRQSYSASKAKGGGVILDLSHELDYAGWFFGKASKVFSFSSKRGELEIETEDNAEIMIEFQNGVWCQVHLDYLQRYPGRSFKLIGTEGTVEADLTTHKMRVFQAGKAEWAELDMGADFQTNEMYLDEVRHFIDCLNGTVESPLISLEDGIKVLQIALAAKESARTGELIPIKRQE